METKSKSSDTSAAPVAKKGGNNMAIIAVAVVLLLGVVGYFVWSGQQKAKADEAEKERIALEAQKTRDTEKKATDAKLKEMQAEAERLRKQAEAERLVAMEQARKQAEEQTRQQMSQQFDAEKKTKFPGILIVTTQPSGAAVTIDADLPRNTPLSLNTIMPGKHRVSVVLHGYDTLETIVDIVGGETTDMGLIQLQKAVGSLDISSTPSDVQYVLRQANAALGSAPIRTGRTPAKLDDLPPGDYVVTYQRLGWQERSVPIAVTKGKSATSTLEYKGGSVVLTSTPSGVQVTRGGIAVGVTPLTLSGLPTQKVEYDFNLAGHEKVTLSGSVVENQSITLNAQMLSFDRVASAREIKSQPKPLTQGQPKIDPAIPVGATATITFVVDRNGSTRDHTFQTKEKSDNAAFAQRCIEAVKLWKFSPALNLEGKPINVKISVPFNVTQQSEEPVNIFAR